ncbi:MAG TPA: thioredoxin fold domain-containing protein [Saprospiraceae bacterium]|nr:thioredoxin fold domain-containing protein [Saprospiraceae bacterium]
MNNLFSILFIILPLTILKGQNDFFKDISTFSHDSSSQNTSLVYFHFKGCAPCKRMDKEVFTNESVKTYLISNFDCFEVYGFDSIESNFRKLYGVKGDPTFLFLNNKGKELHRIVGFFEEEKFINECNKANSTANLSQMDNFYNRGDYDLKFIRDYIRAKGCARQLDSVLIFKYLSFIPDSNLLQWEYFEDILFYGYYEGIWDQPIDSRFYHAIHRAYEIDAFKDFREDMRTRLILSLNFELRRIDLNTSLYDSLLHELSGLENGEPILLKDMYSNGYFAYLVDRYPSFELAYTRAKKGYGNLSATDVFKNQVKRVQNNASELNSLAWGIYEEKYTEDSKLGIELIKRAIEIKPIYSYYDTYAALLYKNGNFIEAQNIANYAIELAKKEGKDYTETQKIIEKIEFALQKD